MTLVFTDPANVFLEKRVDILIPPFVPNDTPTAGFIRLNTKDGNVCNSLNTACINAQVQRSGRVNVIIRDEAAFAISARNTTIDGVTILLTRFHVINGTNGRQATTRSNGRASFDNVPYDAYTVQAFRTGYRPFYTQIDLQQPNIDVPLISLRPLNEPYDVRIIAQMFEPTADFDLNLQVRSDRNTECTVNTFNKYCAYSAHFNDIAFGIGEENIIIRRLSVATYNAYISPAQPYTNNCSAASSLNENIRLYHAQGSANQIQTWNWDIYKLTRPLYTLGICAKTLFFNLFADISLIQFTSFSRSGEVETPENSARLRRIININGVPVIGIILSPTNISNQSTVIPPAPTIDINGTILANSTTTVVNGPCNSTITNFTYTNSTNMAAVLFYDIQNVSVCSNCTNITDRITGNLSIPYNVTTNLVIPTTIPVFVANGTTTTTTTTTNNSTTNNSTTTTTTNTTPSNNSTTTTTTTNTTPSNNTSPGNNSTTTTTTTTNNTNNTAPVIVPVDQQNGSFPLNMAPYNYSNRITIFRYCNLTNITIQNENLNNTFNLTNFNRSFYENIIVAFPNSTGLASSEFSGLTIVITQAGINTINLVNTTFAQIFPNGTGNGTRNTSVVFIPTTNVSDTRTNISNCTLAILINGSFVT